MVIKWIFRAFVFVSTLSVFSISPARRTWKTVNPFLEGKRMPDRPQCEMLSVVGASRQQGTCLWCAFPVPACSSTGGMSNLDKFWSFKSIPFLSQCGLCPVYFLEILPPHMDEQSHGRAVSSGAQSGSDVLTRRYKDAQFGLPWWRGG